MVPRCSCQSELERPLVHPDALLPEWVSKRRCQSFHSVWKPQSFSTRVTRRAVDGRLRALRTERSGASAGKHGSAQRASIPRGLGEIAGLSAKVPIVLELIFKLAGPPHLNTQEISVNGCEELPTIGSRSSREGHLTWLLERPRHDGCGCIGRVYDHFLACCRSLVNEVDTS